MSNKKPKNKYPLKHNISYKDIQKKKKKHKIKNKITLKPIKVKKKISFKKKQKNGKQKE